MVELSIRPKYFPVHLLMQLCLYEICFTQICAPREIINHSARHAHPHKMLKLHYDVISQVLSNGDFARTIAAQFFVHLPSDTSLLARALRSSKEFASL